ncbi:hypothetical protein QC764_209500 [Podospora pseudoanserina]|uniref:MARVEL domain-containing protein n=1 Tax=Podospora pseudoanserina TaxID=2609844 RepID=A0ABR0II13_9PEZI|nr:hypothetical protein QC764_209500 [Podospora pseudoanserina]
MGAAKGTALKTLQFLLRTLQFCCAALVLAVYAYFLATLSTHSLPIGTFVRAVLGIAGAATAYTILAFLLLCCAPGHPFPSFLMMVLDVAFIPCFGYIAGVNRHGVGNCTGEVDTVLGVGNSWSERGGLQYGTACEMEKAVFSVAVAACILFALSCLVNLALARHRKREKRFGPSPANDYTAGYGKKKNRFSALFGRRRGGQHQTDLGPDPNALPVHTTPDEVRNSYGTDNTRVASNQGYGGLAVAQKYEQQTLHSPGVANGDMGLMNGSGNGYANSGNGIANGNTYGNGHTYDGNGNGYGNLPPPQPAARYWNSNTHTGGYRG